MGIPKGITLIVGGGYHGKSTLLNALELGVYNHIQGDGREYVITDSTAQKLRSEDGRFVKDVDISLFINDLPNKKDTTCFFYGRCQRKYFPGSRNRGGNRGGKQGVFCWMKIHLLLILWCATPLCSM